MLKAKVTKVKIEKRKQLFQAKHIKNWINKPAIVRIILNNIAKQIQDLQKHAVLDSKEVRHCFWLNKE